MKKYSFKEAAAKILKEADEPLSAKEITELAIEKGLIETSGATPEATMAAQLYTDINKSTSSEFKKVGKGKFALKKQTVSAKSPLLAIQNQNELARKKLIERIHEMDPFQFEQLIAELLRKIGYENVEVTRRTGDKGIDVVANLTVGGLTDVKTVIQAKRYKKGNNISGKYITQLRGSAEVDQRGLIITTSDFTRSALNEAKAPNKMPVGLVNGENLIDLLFSYKIGVKEQIVSVFSLDSEFFDNEFSDGLEKGTLTKSRSIWPLPGGIDSYIDTLELFLDEVENSSSSRDELLDWYINNFDTVTSTKAANSYLNVPKNMGLIDFKDGICKLTDNGMQYLESKDKDFLFDTISTNILAFEDIYQFLRSSPEAKIDKEILEYVTDNFDVEWTTLAQVNFRLLWLINLGKVVKTGEGFVAK